MMWLKHQRGAMFGLDARIAMAILAGLSIVGGYYMNGVANDARARGLVKEINATREAVQAFQQDVRVNIHQSGVTDDDEAFTALYDRTPLHGSLEGRWRGPYIEFNRNTHADFGLMRLIQRQNTFATDCTSGIATTINATCMVYFYIEDVPLPVIERVDDLIDNYEGNPTPDPQTQGSVVWDEVVADSGRYWLRVRITQALPY